MSVLCLTGSLVFGHQAGAVETCVNPNKPLSVKVRAGYGRVVVDHDSNYAALKGKMEKSGRGLSTFGRASRVIGLTRWQLRNRLSIYVSSKKNDNGSLCFRLSGTRLSLNLGRFDVYIAREIPEKTCKYRTTMEHELEHVHLTREVVKQSVADLERKLRVAAKEIEPLRLENSKKAARRFLDALSARLKPDLQRLRERINAANAHIDTPENYRAEQARCAAG